MALTLRQPPPEPRAARVDLTAIARLIADAERAGVRFELYLGDDFIDLRGEGEHVAEWQRITHRDLHACRFDLVGETIRRVTARLTAP